MLCLMATTGLESAPARGQARVGDDALRRRGSAARSASRHAAPESAFVLFLLASGVLFLRPTELVPALQGLPLYEVLLIGACLQSVRGMERQIRMPALRRQPINACVLGVAAAAVLSHLSHFYLGGVIEAGILFFKILVYYGLLITLVDSPERLHRFLKTLAFCMAAMVGVCVLDYLGWHDFAAVDRLTERHGVDLTGEAQKVARLRGTGLFHDPNDLSMVIIAGGILCAYALTDRSNPAREPLRFAWLVPLIVMATALVLTQSRGGIVAAGCAGLGWAAARRGRKAAVAAGLAGLCTLPVLAGRLGSISLNTGTGHDRILLWREGIAAIESPSLLFGIGQGMYTDVADLVAHNSFVHAYVEWGLFGGTLFFGCFFFAALFLFRLGKQPERLAHPQLARMHPWLAAMLAGWCGGMLSLSRQDIVPTYMIAGLMAAYGSLAAPRLRPPEFLTYWNGRHVALLAAASAGLFASILVVVKVLT